MQYLPLKLDAQANETLFNDLQTRIDSLLGYPNEHATTWATPVSHLTQQWIAMPIDDTCLPALTDAERSALVSYETLVADGWFPTGNAPKPTPWWGIFVWWK